MQLMSSDTILRLSFGKVIKSETIDWANAFGEKARIKVLDDHIVVQNITCNPSHNASPYSENGLFSPRIFGPINDLECLCGKYRGAKYKGTICSNCLVEVADTKTTRYRFGHIHLATPVVPPWFKEIISLLLDLVFSDFERVLHCECYIVVDPGDTSLKSKQLLDDDEYKRYVAEFGVRFRADYGVRAIENLLKKTDLKARHVELSEHCSSGSENVHQKYFYLMETCKVISWDSLILHVIPVFPAGLRAPFSLNGLFPEAELTALYRRIIDRNSRLILIKLILLNAPKIILRNEKRMIQEAVDALFGQSVAVNADGRPLRSLCAFLSMRIQMLQEKLLTPDRAIHNNSYRRFYSQFGIEMMARQTELEELLLKPIDFLELSVRASNCLKNAGLKAVADIVHATEQDLLTRSFGRSTLTEITERLNSMGLSLGQCLTEAKHKIDELPIKIENCKEVPSLKSLTNEISCLLLALCFNLKLGSSKTAVLKDIEHLTNFLDVYVPQLNKQAESYDLCSRYQTEAAELYQQGKYEDVISVCDKLLSLEQTNVYAMLYKGDCLRHLRRYFEAINCYDKYLEFKEWDDLIWLNKGKAYSEAGASDEAIRCYDKALAITSDCVSALIHKGIAFCKLGRPSDAISCYEEVLITDPKDQSALFHKGNALLDLKRYDDAIHCYDKTLEVNPDNSDAWYNKGISLERKRNSKTKSQNDPAEVLKSEIFGDIPSLKLILECYERCLRIDSQYTDALFRHGVILHLLKRDVLALRSLEKALEVESENYHVWYFQAIVQDKLGWKAKTRISFNKFLGLAPDNQEMEANIKHALMRLEDLGEEDR